MKIITGIFIIVFIICPVSSNFAKEYTVSLAKMPVHAISVNQGVLVDLVRAIEKTSGNKIEINVFPFSRSMKSVILNKVDFHIPLIKNDMIPEEKLPYSYSSQTIFMVNFVLYTLKNSKVTLENLEAFYIETDSAHTDYFPFHVIPSGRIEQSLKKLQFGRIDGFIFADSATDPILKKLGYKNIRRQLYKRFEVKIILPKSEHGKEIDQMLTRAIEELKEDGTYEKIIGTVNKPYNNWQP